MDDTLVDPEGKVVPEELVDNTGNKEVVSDDADKENDLELPPEAPHDALEDEPEEPKRFKGKLSRQAELIRQSTEVGDVGKEMLHLLPSYCNYHCTFKLTYIKTYFQWASNDTKHDIVLWLSDSCAIRRKSFCAVALTIFLKLNSQSSTLKVLLCFQPLKKRERKLTPIVSVVYQATKCLVLGSLSSSCLSPSPCPSSGAEAVVFPGHPERGHGRRPRPAGGGHGAGDGDDVGAGLDGAALPRGGRGGAEDEHGGQR